MWPVLNNISNFKLFIGKLGHAAVTWLSELDADKHATMVIRHTEPRVRVWGILRSMSHQNLHHLHHHWRRLALLHRYIVYVTITLKPNCGCITNISRRSTIYLWQYNIYKLGERCLPSQLYADFQKGCADV